MAAAWYYHFFIFFFPLNEPTAAATTPNISLMTSPSAQMIHLDTFTTNKPCQTLPSQRRRLLFCLRVTRGKYVWLREINYSDSFFFHWLSCFVHFYETLRSVCIYITSVPWAAEIFTPSWDGLFPHIHRKQNSTSLCVCVFCSCVLLTWILICLHRETLMKTQQLSYLNYSSQRQRLG